MSQKIENLSTLDLLRIDDISELNRNILKLYSYLFFISDNFKKFSSDISVKINDYITSLAEKSVDKTIDYSSIKIEKAIEKQEEIKITDEEKDKIISDSKIVNEIIKIILEYKRKTISSEEMSRKLIKMVTSIKTSAIRDKIKDVINDTLKK